MRYTHSKLCFDTRVVEAFFNAIHNGGTFWIVVIVNIFTVHKYSKKLWIGRD